jgi:methionyl-tRNA formyltransferase
MTRIVFFGTPEEALPALEALQRQHQVELVVTQPDRPRGRSGRPQPTPVKTFATDAGIPVVQPQTRAELATSLPPDAELGVVVAFGRILRPEVLAAFRHGLLNIHFSLLPRWRGAAPVARALMAGDTMTGVTIIRLDDGLDTGPVLTAKAVDIGPEENAGQLTDRLAEVGAALLARSLPRYVEGSLVPVVQSSEGASYAGKLQPVDRILDQDGDQAVFLGRVRGLAPSPGALLTIDGESVKVLNAVPVESCPPEGSWEAQEEGPVVNVGGSGVALTVLQSPGKRAQSGGDWVRGRHRRTGSVGSVVAGSGAGDHEDQPAT